MHAAATDACCFPHAVLKGVSHTSKRADIVYSRKKIGKAGLYGVLMLSVKEMLARLNLLQDVRRQGRDIAEICRIKVREMPLVTAGEDASEYIPYAIHPDVAGQLGLAVRRLREHMLTYIIEGATVSAHKLPQHDKRSSAMMQALRANQPQLSTHLLHHWCADEQGAGALRRLLHDNWLKAWNAELSTAPANIPMQEYRLQWLAAVNILLLGMIRHEVQRQPEDHADMLDVVMVHVLGASCRWLVREFTLEQLAGLDDSLRQTIFQRLAVPMVSLAFFRRQPKGQIFSDAAHMVTAYGLEAELLPRMRQALESMRGESAANVLAELAAEPMADHLLKRSWARLSLRDMAESSGQAVWIKWSNDMRRLDALLNAPEKVAIEMQSALQGFAGHPFAEWLLSHSKKKGLLSRGGDEAKPWREDDRLLQIFQLFELDAGLELERRAAGERWLNREAVLVGVGRGSEAGKILIDAHAKGKVVLLQKDAKAALFVAGGEASAQGVLCVDWTEYLRVAELRCGAGMPRFLEQAFQPGVMQLVKSLEGVFTDSFSASGLILRGSLPKLLFAGMALRQLLTKWFSELEATSDQLDTDEPVVSMCLAVCGNWSIAKQIDNAPAGRLAFSQGLAQAKSAVSRNDGLRRLLLSFDARDGKRPCGGVRVENIKMADGKSIPILCNRGFALTGSALQALLASTAQVNMQGFQSRDEDAALQAFAAFRLPGGRAEGYAVHVVGESGAEVDVHLLLRIGKVLLGTTVEDVYEVMDHEAPGFKALNDALPGWLDDGAA